MKKILLILLLSGIYLTNNAQTSFAFKSLRYDEDYSYLKKDSVINWYKKTKYISLADNQFTYISFGGEIRYQYFYFKNEDWGEAPKDKDGYILTRWLAHADLHYKRWFRTFVQLQSSLANGMEKTPSPVDENQLDLHQGFVDIVIPLKKENTLTLRAGRQEMSYGSQRLVAVRDGPNNRQSFDAAKLFYKEKSLKADVFFSHYVRSKQKILDDGFNKDIRFWGVYIVKNKIPFLNNIDVYYLGLWKRNAAFDDGVGKELRHSAGTRIWNTNKDFRYDVEGLYQFGRFDARRIRAWTLSVNAGYKFNRVKFKPEIGLKTEFISGDDKYGDSRLQTFNPLFPRGGYFGLVSLIGPSNLFDIHPSLAFDLSNKLFLNMDYDIFWRYSKRDGIYGPNVALIYSGKNSDHRYIGRQFSSDLVYTPNNFLYFRVEFTWFKTGEFLKDVSPGKNILFTAVTAQLKF
jgi:alginate export protein